MRIITGLLRERHPAWRLLAWLLICEHSRAGTVPPAGPALAGPTVLPPPPSTRHLAHSGGRRP